MPWTFSELLAYKSSPKKACSPCFANIYVSNKNMSSVKIDVKCRKISTHLYHLYQNFSKFPILLHFSMKNSQENTSSKFSVFIFEWLKTIYRKFKKKLLAWSVVEGKTRVESNRNWVHDRRRCKFRNQTLWKFFCEQKYRCSTAFKWESRYLSLRLQSDKIASTPLFQERTAFSPKI